MTERVVQMQYREDRSAGLFRAGVEIAAPDAPEAVAIGEEVDSIAVRRPSCLAVERLTIGDRNPRRHWSPGSGETCDENLPLAGNRRGSSFHVFSRMEREPLPIRREVRTGRI